MMTELDKVAAPPLAREGRANRTLGMMFVEPGKRQVRRPVTQRRRGRARRALIAAVESGLFLATPDGVLLPPSRRWTWTGRIAGVDWATPGDDRTVQYRVLVKATPGPVHGVRSQVIVDDPGAP